MTRNSSATEDLVVAVLTSATTVPTGLLDYVRTRTHAARKWYVLPTLARAETPDDLAAELELDAREHFGPGPTLAVRLVRQCGQGRNPKKAAREAHASLDGRDDLAFVRTTLARTAPQHPAREALLDLKSSAFLAHLAEQAHDRGDKHLALSAVLAFDARRNHDTRTSAAARDSLAEVANVARKLTASMPDASVELLGMRSPTLLAHVLGALNPSPLSEKQANHVLRRLVPGGGAFGPSAPVSQALMRYNADLRTLIAQASPDAALRALSDFSPEPHTTEAGQKANALLLELLEVRATRAEGDVYKSALVADYVRADARTEESVDWIVELLDGGGSRSWAAMAELAEEPDPDLTMGDLATLAAAVAA